MNYSKAVTMNWNIKYILAVFLEDENSIHNNEELLPTIIE